MAHRRRYFGRRYGPRASDVRSCRELRLVGVAAFEPRKRIHRSHGLVRVSREFRPAPDAGDVPDRVRRRDSRLATRGDRDLLARVCSGGGPRVLGGGRRTLPPILMTSIIATSTILRGTAPSRTRILTNMISSATAICTFRTSIIGTVIDGLRALAFASFAATAYAAPYVPKDEATVLERLPVRPGDPVARELRQLRTDLAANPRDRETA